MWRRLSDLGGHLVSVYGFLEKEVVGVLHQPRLIASLVLGPFLIMLVFGLAYRGPQPEFRTILVVPPEPAIAAEIDLGDAYREGLSGVFKPQQVLSDEAAALAELRADRADVVVVVPPDLFQQVSAGQQAALKVYYIETDPTSNAWVRYFASVQTGELNRRLLLRILRQTKGPAIQTIEYTELILEQTDALEAELRAGDAQAAAPWPERLLRASEGVPGNLGEAVDLLSGAIGPNQGADPTEARRRLGQIESELSALRLDLQGEISDPANALRRVQEIRQRAREVNALAAQISGLPIELLVSPLSAQAQNVAPVEPSPVSFYTPAVLALLLQHIAVTLSSLSGVRDRLLGSLELFRVSPVGAGHLLIGKSLGFGLLLAVVGAVLTLALTALLDVPLLGSPAFFALVIGLIIFASIGLGFALAVLAASESQAVQLSMLVLLTSVFFGGFFPPTNLLFAWVRSISFLLPVTYGAINLRDLMLRGSDPASPYLLGPLALGLVFYLLATLGLAREMRRA